MRRCVLLGSVIIMGLLAVPSVWACSCRVSSPREAIEWADVVFAGLVVETARDAEGINDGSLFATIDIAKVWKGNLGGRIVVRTAPNSAQCGYYFEKDKRYLVYAVVNADGVLSTNSCSRTNLLERADEDILALEVPLLVEDDGLCGGPTNIAAMQAMFFVFLVVVLRRRRRT